MQQGAFTALASFAWPQHFTVHNHEIQGSSLGNVTLLCLTCMRVCLGKVMTPSAELKGPACVYVWGAHCMHVSQSWILKTHEMTEAKIMLAVVKQAAVVAVHTHCSALFCIPRACMHMHAQQMQSRGPPHSGPSQPQPYTLFFFKSPSMPLVSPATAVSFCFCIAVKSTLTSPTITP